MPIILEHIHTPTEQDWQDLEQIFASAQPESRISRTSIEHKLNQTFWVIAGRFNDRLSGCLLAQKSLSNQVELSQACVRELTQGRGVMHQMLALLIKWADAQSLDLIFKDVPEHLQEVLANRDFQYIKSNSWIKQAKNNTN